ncbi:MAG: pyridoxal-phosphate dependent enzyme [Pseudomonadota bacterium]
MWRRPSPPMIAATGTSVKLITNRLKGQPPPAPSAPFPSVDAERAGRLMARALPSDMTPLAAPDLAPVAALWVKDERTRMGLGSFKALGAAYVIADHAVQVHAEPGAETLKGRTYATASAGNHGLSLAMGARKFGARAVVYIAQTVPEGFAARLEAQGAEVRREGADYAASMAAAERASNENGWTLLSDSSWDGYSALPWRLMEGYTHMGYRRGASSRSR